MSYERTHTPGPWDLAKLLRDRAALLEALVRVGSLGMLTMFAGCASLPTQMVDGVAIYERSAADVAQYCYGKLSAEERMQPHIYGCYVPADHLIMVEVNHPEVVAHELRHAHGWKHRGPCHSTVQFPDGLKPDGSPCEWYR